MCVSVHTSEQVCNIVCVCVCGTPLSRHICLALISFAWHRDRPVSLVFNNSLDSGHLSRSEYSWRIVHSFGQNLFKVIMFFLFSETGCKEAPVSPSCWGMLKHKSSLPRIFWLRSSSSPFSSLRTFIFSSVIVLICHVSDPYFQVIECFQGSSSALSPLLFLIRAIGVRNIPGRETGPMFRCLLSQNQ